MHAKVEAFEWMLAAAGRTVASQYYPGTGHVATLRAYSPMVIDRRDEPRRGLAAPLSRLSRHDRLRRGYGMWMPEIARAITRRWISDVPSKIV